MCGHSLPQVTTSQAPKPCDHRVSKSRPRLLKEERRTKQSKSKFAANPRARFRLNAAPQAVGLWIEGQLRFSSEIQIPEARAFYGFQIAPISACGLFSFVTLPLSRCDVDQNPALEWRVPAPGVFDQFGSASLGGPYILCLIFCVRTTGVCVSRFRSELRPNMG